MASVCSVSAEKRAIVYMYFDPVTERFGYYLQQFERLQRLIGDTERLMFFLCCIKLNPHADYTAARRDWIRTLRSRTTRIR